MTVGQKRKRPAPDYAMTVIDRSASQLCNTGTTTTYSSPATSLSSSPSPAPESPRDRLVAASTDTAPQDAGDGVDMAVQLERVASSSRTPFEKRVLSLLCQIPRGRVSTYGLLSAHLGSSPRAIGGALRRNPFAPQGKQRLPFIIIIIIIIIIILLLLLLLPTPKEFGC